VEECVDHLKAVLFAAGLSRVIDMTLAKAVVDGWFQARENLESFVLLAEVQAMASSEGN
jgi:hypothetical protein